MTRKVCVVVTARPSYARIKSALHAIQVHGDLELQLVVAGSALLERFGQTAEYIEADGFDIAARVYTVVEGQNLLTSAKSTGFGLAELSTVFDNLAPDVVITIADRFETLATSIAAAYLNIPLAHVQGGEVSGSIDEKVRHANTKLANLHFVASQKAAERVCRMGEDPATVFNTGCPSIDLAADIMKSPKIDCDPYEKYEGIGSKVSLVDDYIVVIQHPVTSEHEAALTHITETLYAIHDLDIPALWFWPNLDAGSDGTSNGIRAFREDTDPKNIYFFKNMMPHDFLRLIYNSRCVVGNSSVAIRECSFLGIPAVNIGTRQQGRERGGNVLDTPYHRDAIREAIKTHLKNGHVPSETIYGQGKAGNRIAELLATVPLTSDKRLTY